MAGFITFLSFTVFGLVPLLMYCGLPLAAPTLSSGLVFMLGCACGWKARGWAGAGSCGWQRARDQQR